ncbi:hypothetical protein GUJ93_ZPchr0007g4360 [Zizania palustris]|uniref:Uncharacterized protein n=1 Tax=Zizania palustris TaxID=103762 RepID=A0A8J5W5B9_ZIZPA|nr:hypothetical protein GUJ93_ZPchr0007g4360 [Zizania palustris]
MLRVQGSLRVHTFSSAACVHNVESSDDDGGGGADPSTRCSAVLHSSKKASRKEMKKMVRKLLSSVRRRHHAPQVSRPHSEAGDGDGDGEGVDAAETGGGQSDRETFVSAKCSEVCSLCTDDDGPELPSFRLSPSIFPAGGAERQSQPTACPMRVIMKLPFGFIVGRQLHAPAAIMPSMKLSLTLKKMVPKLADLQSLQFRSKMIKTKVVCAIKERFGRGGSRRGEGGNSYRNGNNGDGDDDNDEDVFWKKDVRGLRCRRVEDSDASL